MKAPHIVEHHCPMGVPGAVVTNPRCDARTRAIGARFPPAADLRELFSTSPDHGTLPDRKLRTIYAPLRFPDISAKD